MQGLNFLAVGDWGGRIKFIIRDVTSIVNLKLSINQQVLSISHTIHLGKRLASPVWTRLPVL